MNSFFDKLNLRPQERRLVVIVGIVVFILINVWLIIPRFGDFSEFQANTKKAQDTVTKYEAEIKKQSSYQKELTELQGQGVFVPSEEAALRLYQEVNSQANLTGLGYSLITPATRGSTTKSNAFFEETSVTVNVRTGEKELIDFLHRLTDKELMIRAKSMDLGPDPTRMMLQGSITLVKSFQRKPPPKPKAAAGAAAKTNTPAKAPAAAPAKPASAPAKLPALPPATGGAAKAPKG